MKNSLIEAIRKECAAISYSVGDHNDESALVSILGGLNEVKAKLSESGAVTAQGPSTGFLPDYYFKMSFVEPTERRMIEEFIKSTGVTSASQMTEDTYLKVCEMIGTSYLLESSDVISTEVPEFRPLRAFQKTCENDFTRVNSTVIPTTPQRTVINENGIPAYLKGIPRWCCWTYFAKRDLATGRVTYIKEQVNHNTGILSSPDEKASGVPFEDAYLGYTSSPAKISGIGFILDKGVQVYCINLMNCIKFTAVPASITPFRDLSDLALKIISSYCDTHIELSPSGKGVTVLSRGSLTYDKGMFVEAPEHEYPEQSIAWSDSSPDFVGITGNIVNLDYEALTPNPYGKLWLQMAYMDRARPIVIEQQSFPRPTMPPQDVDEPPAWTDDTGLSDEALLQKANSAGNAAKFAQYWSKSEPNPDFKGDYALLGMLNFYASSQKLNGQGAAQLDRLFRSSGRFATYEGWDRITKAGKTRGQALIDKVIASQRATFGDNR